MKLTRAGEYGVRCALYLAHQEPGAVVSRRIIAEAMEIPVHFLGKIAQQLAAGGIIEIVQGAKGGYRLSRSSADISLLDVVEAVEGQIFLNQCLMRPDTCQRSGYCAVHEVWGKAQDDMRATLASASLADLAKRELL